MSRKHRKQQKEFNDTNQYNAPPLLAQTFTQQQYLDSLNHDEMTVAIGAAGTGKTFLPCALYSDLYRKGHIDKIILTRPNVSCGADMGHLPGTLDEKFAEWTTPMTSVIKQRIGRAAYEIAVKKENIQAIPLQFMRGATFDNAAVILDEAQNTTVEQMQMLLTRIGYDGKLVICGDIFQSDIDKRAESGLSWLIKNLRQQQVSGVEIIEFQWEDCVRSDLCKRMLQMIHRAA